MDLDWLAGWLCRRLRLPPLRQKLLQLAHGRGNNPGEHASQVGLRIDAMALGAGDEGGKDGGGLGRFVVAGEEPVLPVMESSP